MNLDILNDISFETPIEKINNVFQDLIVEIQNILNLEILNSNIKLVINQEENFNSLEELSALDIGVIKHRQNGQIIIELLDNYNAYLKIILLREAYFSFVPDNLIDNEIIKIFIFTIVCINLPKDPVINEWKSFVREELVNYEFLAVEYDRLEKFLALEGSKTAERPVIFFFKYIRRNFLVIDENKEEFYNGIFQEFVLKTSKSLRSDEIIETIRVLIKIFYKLKSYKALLDYQNYFKELKGRGEIQTNLSLRKFTNNMKWINRYSYIAPSYQVNWKVLNVAVLAAKLIFNPLLSKEQLDRVMEKMPFFVFSKSSENNFSLVYAGWFVIPQVYLKDLKSYLQKLEQNGYLIDKTCILLNSAENFLNLNYFREFYKNKRIINPSHKKYDERYEIHFKFDYGEEFIDKKWSILDFLILERIRYYSITGFSFERRAETLKALKNDLINEIFSQRGIIKSLKDIIKKFNENERLRQDFINFVNNNNHFGFFSIKELLDKLIIVISLLLKVLNENPQIKTISQLNEYILKHNISKLIDENTIFKDSIIKKLVLNEIIPLFFQNRLEFIIEKEKYELFCSLFESVSNLKIFNLEAIIRIVEEKGLFNQIYDKKEQNLKNSFERYKSKKITSDLVEKTLDTFINQNPPLIKPILITTFGINDFASYYLHILLKNSNESLKILKEIKRYFPRVTLNSGFDIYTNEELIQVEIYLPNIIEREKSLLISILYNLFKENLISIRRYFYDGFHEAYSRKNFYDFESSNFFYTEDLFIQFFKYCEHILGKKLPTSNISIKENSIDQIFTKEKNFNSLVKNVEDRISREETEFDLNKINELSYIYDNLETLLIDSKKFKQIKQKTFFTKYIHSIKFKPALNHFNLGVYYLYIHPIDLKETDMVLLLANSFQKVKYPAFVDNTPSFLIKYIFPQDNPNKAHLNYIVKSLKVISEYCLFKINRMYQILHLDRNLDSNGWYLSEKAFKAHVQKVLFNPEMEGFNLGIKEFDIGSTNLTNIYNPSSREFDDLSKIYNFKSLDLKSILGSKKQSQINAMQNLVKKKIVFPFLKLKNLNLQEKIYLILPNINKELIKKIIKILNYFPFGICYEITGEFYRYGVEGNNEKRFESGLFVKLHLPPTVINSFQKAFNLIFDYLGIKKRLILIDLVDGSHFIQSLLGNLDFKKSYNPLNNLKWNDVDKRWMNIKLYGEDFVKKYPMTYKK